MFYVVGINSESHFLVQKWDISNFSVWKCIFTIRLKKQEIVLGETTTAMLTYFDFIVDNPTEQMC